MNRVPNIFNLFLKARRRGLAVISRIYRYYKGAHTCIANARQALEQGNFELAKKYYHSMINIVPDELEAYIGYSICDINMSQYESALSILSLARERFTYNPSVFSLIIKCHLELKQIGYIKENWLLWKSHQNGDFSSDFYRVSGDVLVELIDSSVSWEYDEFINQLIRVLVYQQDNVVDVNSHPTLCSILFHQHEYNRNVYCEILSKVRDFVDSDIKDETSLYISTASLLLTFDMVSDQLRKKILEKYFYDFGIFSHWSFILIGSAINSIWDLSLQKNKESLPIVIDIIKEELKSDRPLSPLELYKLILLSSVCCQECLPDIIKYTQDLLPIRNGLSSSSDILEDLEFIVGNYQKEVPTSNKKERLKIAVCISGQLRGWRKAINSWKEYSVFGEHDTTYIIHTWKDTGINIPQPPKDERALPKSFFRSYRTCWNKFGEKEMYTRYPHFFALWSEKSEVTKEELQAVYGTSHIVIEDDTCNPFVKMSNAEKMYYKISQCHEFVEQLGDKFDLIVRIRPDFQFLEGSHIDWNNIYEKCRSQRVLLSDMYSRYLFPNIGFCMPDQLAISTPETMRAYASAYKMTISNQNQKFKYFPVDFLAHRNVAYSTLYYGVSVEGIGIPCTLAPSFKPTHVEIYEAIVKDSQGRMDSYDRSLLEALR
jgi:hypothetical protein